MKLVLLVFAFVLFCVAAYVSRGSLGAMLTNLALACLVASMFPFIP